MNQPTYVHVDTKPNLMIRCLKFLKQCTLSRDSIIVMAVLIFYFGNDMNSMVDEINALKRDVEILKSQQASVTKMDKDLIHPTSVYKEAIQ